MSSMLTRNQIERMLAQKIQTFYQQRLQYQPDRISCHYFNQNIAIVLEGNLTPAEQLLQSDHPDVTQRLHTKLNLTLKLQLRQLIESVVGVPVVDLLSDSRPQTGRTGFIAVLGEPPHQIFSH